MLRFARLDSLENGALSSLTQTLPGVPSPPVTEPAQNESSIPALSPPSGPGSLPQPSPQVIQGLEPRLPVLLPKSHMPPRLLKLGLGEGAGLYPTFSQVSCKRAPCLLGKNFDII